MWRNWEEERNSFALANSFPNLSLVSLSKADCSSRLFTIFSTRKMANSEAGS